MLAQILQSTQTRTETYCLIRQTNPVPALPVSAHQEKKKTIRENKGLLQAQ